MTSIVLAGGGTAGHTSPLIATADRLRIAVPGIRLLAIGTPKGLESRVIPAAGLRLDLIPPVPMPRKPGMDLVRLPLRLRTAVAAAKAILVRERADAVVGFGGYVSMPVYLAARLLRLPIVIHEQNAVPGLANKVAARFTSQVAVSFPDTPLPHARYIGLPLRAAITDLAGTDPGSDALGPRATARKSFGLAPDLPTLLVSGGSSGARSINAATEGARAGLLAAGIQVLHVLGSANFADEMAPITDQQTGARYCPVGYVDQMETAYAAADLMLCRSGAGTVVETAVLGLPAVFVPLPHGNGEQARNAQALVEAGGALLVADADCTGRWLLDRLPGLVDNPDRLRKMRAAGRGLMPADAAQTLASMVLAVTRR